MDDFKQVVLEKAAECRDCKYPLKSESIAYRDSENNHLLCPTCYDESYNKQKQSLLKEV